MGGFLGFFLSLLTPVTVSAVTGDLAIRGRSATRTARRRRKAASRDVRIEWIQADMRTFDLSRSFDLVFSAGNSLLHLHTAADLITCFQSVRRRLRPGARFVFDVFKPDVATLAGADGIRRTRESLGFSDAVRGPVSVDVAETYDASAR